MCKVTLRTNIEHDAAQYSFVDSVWNEQTLGVHNGSRTEQVLPLKGPSTILQFCGGVAYTADLP